MAWTAPKTYVAGAVHTAAELNTYERDNMLALTAGRFALSDQAAGDDMYAISTTQWAVGARQLRQTFRGLTLGTHPDADVAASKVFLKHADEIVMHDGTRVADWNNLTADITASGANGLDTGTEASSRPYEIHAIRKSSDGTKGLLLHLAKRYAADQSFTTTQDVGRLLRVSTGTATDKIAQGFQVSTAGQLELVEIQINKGGSPSGRVWLTIEADSGGNPSGTPLATSDKLDVSPATSNAAWVMFPFRAPATLATGTQYHLVLQGDYTRSDSAAIAWRGVVAGGYANGASKEYNGSSWSATAGASGLDRLFRLFITVPSAALTLPSGYDQYCLIGYCYNNSSGDLVAFRQHDRSVRTGYQAVAATTSATFATLVDLSAIVPPVPVLIDSWEMANTAAGSVNSVYGDWNGQTAYASGFLWTAPGNSYFVDINCVVPVEHQRAYISVSANAGYFYVSGWRF